jgi:hypothetical protein
MAKGRFLNQKLGKRASRQAGLLKAQLAARQHAPGRTGFRAPKKGASRQPNASPTA